MGKVEKKKKERRLYKNERIRTETRKEEGTEGEEGKEGEEDGSMKREAQCKGRREGEVMDNRTGRKDKKESQVCPAAPERPVQINLACHILVAETRPGASERHSVETGVEEWGGTLGGGGSRARTEVTRSAAPCTMALQLPRDGSFAQCVCACWETALPCRALQRHHHRPRRQTESKNIFSSSSCFSFLMIENTTNYQ